MDQGLKSKLVTAAAVAFGLLAYVAKPTQAEFEHYADSAFSAQQSRALSGGHLFDWFKSKSADLLRTGRFEPGVFVNTYYVTIGGETVAKCRGALQTIWCDRG